MIDCDYWKKDGKGWYAKIKGSIFGPFASKSIMKEAIKETHSNVLWHYNMWSSEKGRFDRIFY